MNSFLSTLVLLGGLTQTSGVVVRTDPVATTTPASSPVYMATTEVPSEASLAGALGSVLVIPTPDLPAEGRANLTEDLTVMCRIFDKSVPAAGGNVSFAYGDRADSLRWVIAQQGRGTQGLYLDGYGALFFIRVDYPLAPAEKPETAQAQSKEPVDSVWSQTAREMSGQPGDEPQSARTTPAYDAQKVENLKKTLVKTLAHASNIRMRRPQDAITLVVGALDEVRTSAYGRYGPAGRGTTRISPARPGVAAGAAQPGTRSPAAALMILRVAKADVDAFAKNQLTLIQFTDKVQILFSPSVSNVPATSATGPTPVSTRR